MAEQETHSPQEIVNKKTLEQRVEELEDLVQQITGAGKLVKFCLLVVGPIVGIITYLRAHWSFH